ncbi:tryptophan synthase subunit beta [Halopseudomonas xinjiangensis]|nr:tryptophan synthase subunit beta [Halopseudomonas xinjiangensis]
MVYVQRDADGLLLRVESRPFEGMTDTLAVESAELATWLKTREEIHGRLQALKQTDMDMVRVLEDVVIVLVERGVISFTDLPEAARQKLDERALARADLEGFSGAITGRLGRQAVVDR